MNTNQVLNLDRVYQPTTINIENLLDHNYRRRWSVHPLCQRNFVWDQPRMQKLIDSILRGIPIPPIAYVQSNIDLGGTIRYLVDGQQRFETICKFIDNKFPTAIRFRNEIDVPACKGQYYRDFDPQMKGIFDSYSINAIIIHNISDDDIDRMYRRWQLGMPLSSAEKLYAYSGKVKTIADEIAGHDFWNIIYSGEKKRKRQFQGSVKLIMIENRGGHGWINTTLPQQIDTLAKKIEDVVAIKNKIIGRLDEALHVFNGLKISDINYVTLIYQILLIIDIYGCKYSLLKSGSMTEFFNNVIFEINKEGHYSTNKINNVSYQQEFYNKNISAIAEILKPGIRDEKRSADWQQRNELWKRQEFKCAACGNPISIEDGQAHHVKRYSIGGKTDIDNMVLIHRDCHNKIHSAKDTQSA